MVNYNNSCIYKLCCKDTNIKDIYIGSTTGFRKRKWNHKSTCNNPNDKHHNYNVYKCIRENGGFENWDMILIENINVNTKLELLKQERKYIELLKPSLNMIIPSRTDKEQKKNYYIENKDYIDKRNMNHYYKNHSKYTEKFDCDCGGKFTKRNKLTHTKTKKHLKFIQSSFAYTEP